MEFRGGTVIATCSLPLGSLTLYLEHVKDNLPSKKKFREIQLDVATHLEEFEILISSPYPTVHGVGRHLRARSGKQRPFRSALLQFGIPRSDIEDILDRFLRSNKLALENCCTQRPMGPYADTGNVHTPYIAATCRCQTLHAHKLRHPGRISFRQSFWRNL